MSQKEKKVNTKLSIFDLFKNQPWWSFLCINLALPCLLIILSTGLALWFHAVLFSLLINIFSYYIFNLFLSQQIASTTELRGYDQWHLKSLLEFWKNHPKIHIENSKTPFIKSFSFFNKQVIILSSALLLNVKREDLKLLLEYQKIYFHHNLIKNSTCWCFYLFIFNFHFHLLGAIFKFIPGFQKVMDLSIKLESLLLTIWTRRIYLRMDKKIAEGFKNLTHYKQWLWRMQTYLETLDKKPRFLESSFYFTNPLTDSFSCFNIQPPVQKRLDKLESL